MRQLSPPIKSFEKREIATIEPIRKLLLDWDIMILRLREVRIKMTKALKS